MSGVEVAGLVLGALPLIVTAIEDYSDGLRTLKKMKNVVQELDLLQCTLRVEHATFLNSLELLLGDDVDSRTMFTLLNDVGGPLWREESIEDSLRTRLQRDYQIFLAAVKSMKKAVSDLQRKLNLDPNEKTFWRSALSKLKAGLSLIDYSRELGSISAANNLIDRLVTQTNRLRPVRKSRDRLPDSDATRAQATSIFASLQAGFSQHCGHSHFASLALASPLSKIEIHAGHLGRNASRQTLLVHHEVLSASAKQPQWSLETAEVCLLHQGMDKADRVPTFRQTTTVGANKSAKGVQYEQRITKIQDLCQYLSQSTHRRSGACFGYLSDNFSLCHYGLWWPQYKTGSNKASPKSLNAIFTGGARQSGISDSFKRHLALSLARGMLDLFDTPWLKDQWGRKEILLSGALSGQEVIPFISSDVKGNLKSHRYFQSSSLIKDETVFSLGVLLIEVCMEQTFDELSSTANTDSKSLFQDYIIADGLLNEVYNKLGPRYGNAARRCIRCEFDQRKTSLDDPAFRKAVYDGVVAELQRDVETIS